MSYLIIAFLRLHKTKFPIKNFWLKIIKDSEYFVRYVYTPLTTKDIRLLKHPFLVTLIHTSGASAEIKGHIKMVEYIRDGMPFAFNVWSQSPEGASTLHQNSEKSRNPAPKWEWLTKALPEQGSNVKDQLIHSEFVLNKQLYIT